MISFFLTKFPFELKFIGVNKNNNNDSNKYYTFLNGFKLRRKENQTTGVLLEENNDLLPPHLKPILENDVIIVRQDTKFPIPAFYILSVKDPVPSLADIPVETAMLLGGVVKIIREAMRDVLGVERVNFYQEEKKKNPHYHQWVLPMWEKSLTKNDLSPRIWENEIMDYMKSFNFDDEDKKILSCNSLMRKHLSKMILEKNSILSNNNFRT